MSAESDANFVLVDVAACGVSADVLVERLLALGVFVRKLGVHHAGRSMVRITVGTSEQNARCVQALRRVLGSEERAEPWPAAASDAE